MGLNKEQRAVVDFEKGVLQVVAGPGTGKTEALVSRVVRLLKRGVPADSIMIVTFTRKAAEEFYSRLLDKSQEFDVDPLGVYCGTLHSLCFQVMEEFDFEGISEKKLIDDFSRKVFIYDVFKDRLGDFEGFFRKFAFKNSSANGEQFIDTLKENPTKFVGLIEALVDRIIYYSVDVERLKEEGGVYREAAEIFEAYQVALNERNFIDFNEVELFFLEFLNSEHGREFREKLKHLLVDEYQDTNPLDEKIYFKIAENVESFVVVGDEDQALFSFRGATVKSFLNFEKRVKEKLSYRLGEKFPLKKVFLRKNYRSDVDIVNFLNLFVNSFPHLERVEGKRRFLLKSVRGGNGKRRVSYLNYRKEKIDRFMEGGGSLRELRNLIRREFAKRTVSFVKELLEKETITKVSDCVVLVPSAKEKENSFIKYLRTEFEKEGIKLYNPRSKNFGEKRVVKKVLELLKFVVEGGELPDVKNAEKLEEIREKFRSGELSLLESFYALLPVLGFINGENVAPPELLFDLSHLSGFIKQFELVYDRDEIKEKFRTVFVEMIRGADEAEIPTEYLPEDYLPVMTIHQAKGLEFPVVFVAVDWLPENDSDEILNYLRDFVDDDVRELLPPETDSETVIRKLFVAYSRAKELLVILDTTGNFAKDSPLYPYGKKELSYNYREEKGELSTDWKGESRKEKEQPKFYSYTGDIVSFNFCPRLYALRKFFRFQPSSALQEWFGTSIHRTIRRVYTFYRLNGRMPTDRELHEIFNKVCRVLEVEGITITETDRKNYAFRVVNEFLKREGEEFFRRVVAVELPVKEKRDGYYLQGVVDAILEGEDGFEVWDFKSMRNPKKKGNEEKLELYRKQLLFYRMILSKNRRFRNVEKLVLCFLNELLDKEPQHIESFDPSVNYDDFWKWVKGEIERIEECRRKNFWPVAEKFDENTCNSCDFRFGCPIIQAT